MYNKRKTNKLPMIDYLVVTGDQALASGSLVTAGTNFNIANGQLGLLSWDATSSVKARGTFLASGDDSSEVQAVRLVVGTPVSANTQLADVWGVSDSALIHSGVIYKNSITSIAVKKAVLPVFGAQAITNFTAPVNNVQYDLYVKLDSVRYDREYSTMNDNVIHASAPVVNFTALSTTSPLDYVLENLAYTLNLSSKAVSAPVKGIRGNKSYVVLGVKAAPTAVVAPTVPTVTLTGGVVTAISGGTGGSGYTVPPVVATSGGSPSTAATITAQINSAGAITGYTIVNGGAGYGTTPTITLTGGLGQVIGTVTPTTNITFMNVDGVPQVLKSSNELCQTLARLVKDNPQLTATSTIEVIDKDVAGAYARIDGLIVVGLAQDRAAIYDNVEQLQVRPYVNVGKGFLAAATDPTVTTCNPIEGTGQGWKWKINEDWRAGVDTFTKQVQPHGDWFSLGKSYLNINYLYTSYIIDYFDTENTLTTFEVSPKQAVLFFRSEIPSSFTVTVNNIIARPNTDIQIVTSNDAGTGTASATTVAAVEAVVSPWFEHARVNGNPFTVTGDAVAGGTYLS